MQSKNKFYNLVNHPFKFRMYLLYKLPAAFFSGVKIKECTQEKCVTSLPYKWLTQNPFRSTYFASLSMAAEMSTGALALSNTYKKVPAISMLVTKMEANYFKKATGLTFFTCVEGMEIADVVKEAGFSAEGRSITVKTTGKNKNGELIAEFFFTWSFKKRR
ncbi:MAG TPA: DUF4442 domain-containing protein [Hanamia sp.]|nr:DUF4442 domain-containing protein [Hanamia sp.]